MPSLKKCSLWYNLLARYANRLISSHILSSWTWLLRTLFEVGRSVFATVLPYCISHPLVCFQGTQASGEGQILIYFRLSCTRSLQKQIGINSLYRVHPLARHTLSLSTLETGVGGHKLKASLDYIHSKSLSQKHTKSLCCAM